MPTALVSLGSNLGNRQAHLKSALERLNSLQHCRLEASSHVLETVPAGGLSGQSHYLNACARLHVECSPFEFFRDLQAIEIDLGRIREIRWGPRTIDLDLLLFGSTTLATKELVVPHPRLAFRRFVLQPAREIAPQFVHPVLARTMDELYHRLQHNQGLLVIAGADRMQLLEITARVHLSCAMPNVTLALLVVGASNSSVPNELTRLEFVCPNRTCNVSLIHSFSEARLLAIVRPRLETLHQQAQWAELRCVAIRAGCPWIDVSCGAVPQEDIEPNVSGSIDVESQNLGWCAQEIAGAIQAMQ